MGTLQVGGTTLGVKNSGTGKVDLSNVGTVAATSITSGTLGSSVVVPASAGASMDLLDTYSPDNSATSAYFNLGSYTSYTGYKILAENYLPATDNADLKIQLGTTSSAITSSYYELSSRLYHDGTSTYAVTTSNRASGGMLLTWGMYIGNDINEQGLNGEAWLYAPLSTSYFTAALGNAVVRNGGGHNSHYSSSGFYLAANANPYIFLVSSSGNLKSGKFMLFGVKNA